MFNLALEQSADVRCVVCTGLVQLLTVAADKVAPHMTDLIQYMLEIMKSKTDNQNLAVESCEFWMAFCEAEVQPSILHPYLQQLIPMLLSNMVRHGTAATCLC